MDIIKIIAKSLEPISLKGIPVVQGWYDKNINDTHITFTLLNDSVNSVSDDEEETISYFIQIDIWGKKDEWKLKKEVKKLMLESDFGYDDGQDFFENDTKIYHKALRFKYVEDLEI